MSAGCEFILIAVSVITDKCDTEGKTVLWSQIKDNTDTWYTCVYQIQKYFEIEIYNLRINPQ